MERTLSFTARAWRVLLLVCATLSLSLSHSLSHIWNQPVHLALRSRLQQGVYVRVSTLHVIHYTLAAPETVPELWVLLVRERARVIPEVLLGQR